MKILISAFVLLAATTVSAVGQSCVENAKEIKPQLSKEAVLKFSENLAVAAQNAAAQPSADNVIWHARRKGYLGQYKDAIDALTVALKKFPNDARIYRHRGHRYITLRCFDAAIRDFEAAAKLIKGKPDEVEPDGMPNAKNIPTSTLQSNIWYHLGLAYYLNGDFKRALDAYHECMKVSKNNDMLAATAHWKYMTLRRLEKFKDAERVLEPFDGDFEVIENEDYLKLLRLYRGDVKSDRLEGELGDEADMLGNATLGYGLGNWYLYNGNKAKSAEIFRKIVKGDQWASFGYIAAEMELTRN